MSELKHYGTPRHSGRYPWGSGKNPQRNKGFSTRVAELERSGMSRHEIAKGFGFTDKELDAAIATEQNEIKKEQYDRAQRLKTHGYSDKKVEEMTGVTRYAGSTEFPRHTGRYSADSKKNPNYDKNFYDKYNELKDKKYTEKQIANEFGMTIDHLRARKRIATNAVKKEQVLKAQDLHNKGYNNSQVAKMMNTSESNIRNWIKEDALQKRDSVSQLADILKEQVDNKKYVDIGRGVELSLNASQEKLKSAVEILKDQGYYQTNVQVDQSGTKNGNKTLIKVLAHPGATYREVADHKHEIKTIEDYVGSDIPDEKFVLPPIKSISSDRVFVNYAEQTGTQKDGLIEIRRGLKDLNLGNAMYAQARMAVDGSHYLKGMVIYSDDIPEGYDVVFNTSKSEKKGKLGVMKPLNVNKKTGEIDKDNPFGASIKSAIELKRVPRYYTDEKGEQQVSPINVVNEEGDWEKWTKTLASQMLAKQPLPLINRQLKLTYQDKKTEFEAIKEINNPVVKKKLLESFASDCDASAVHLKAMSFPDQASHVILPLPNIKPNEIFAPRYEDGTTVALVRFPHGGTFEIPILKVNNKIKEGIKYIGLDSPDAVGIHPSAGERLSGADYDGDTALVIPFSDEIQIQSTPLLDGLKGFDPRKEYAIDRSDPVQNKIKAMSSRQKQILMGSTTNLITDMTLAGASPEEKALATKHSMVVIDAEKHDLDFRRSAKEHHIRDLQALYQRQADGTIGGASTLLSRAKSPIYVNTRKQKGIDPNTGEIIYEDIPKDSFPIRDKDKNVIGIGHKKFKSTQMAETKDARTLISVYNTPQERAYADYANNLKALANEARKEMVNTKMPKKDPEAARAYKAEVSSLMSQLNMALKNSPRERQAQLIADQKIEMMKANGELTDEDKESKLRARQLSTARLRVGAKKQPVQFTQKEWDAVQANAISPNVLNQLLNNADMDKVRKLATPRTSSVLSPSQIAYAKMLVSKEDGGYSIASVAQKFGVSPSTLSKALSS